MNARHLCMSLVATLLTLLAGVPAAQAESSGEAGDMARMLEQLDMLDQLDQLDRQDFEAAIAKVYACSDARDFGCADVSLATAGTLVYDDASRQALADARTYRGDMQRIAEQEQQRLARQARIQECSDPVPHARSVRGLRRG